MAAAPKLLPSILFTFLVVILLTFQLISHQNSFVKSPLQADVRLCNQTISKQSLDRDQMKYHFSNRNMKTIIVSGADSKYYEGVKNLIGSVNFWDSERYIMIYNLGLTANQLEQLSLIPKVTVHWPTGVPSYLPNHVRNLGTFTWKAYAIQDALERHKKVFWIDAGSDFRAPLDSLDKGLEEDGFFFINRQDGGKIGRRNLHHVGTFEYFNVSKADFEDKVIILGGYQGYVRGSYGYNEILMPLLECSSVERCMVPPGSSLANHRYDQTALSLLIHRLGSVVSSKLHDVASVTRKGFFKDCTRPSRKLIFTARNESADYTEYIQWKRNV